MVSKSKLKTWFKRKGFKPIHANSRNFLKYGLVSRNNKYFRIRFNEHQFSGGEKRVTVDISCFKDEFDRWANSCDEHAVPLEEFMKLY